MNPAPDPLAELEAALQAERRALLAHDAEALLDSTRCKLAAVRTLQGLASDAVAPARVSELSALNQANHVLLTRRRREVSWALRQLGRLDATAVYDAAGQPGARPQARCLGVG